jgi:O-methyltransferase involved in polyketide biosynthesis
MCQRLTYFDHAQVDQLWVNHTSTAAGAPSVVRNMHREMLLGRQENSWKIMEIWKGQKELGVY